MARDGGVHSLAVRAVPAPLRGTFPDYEKFQEGYLASMHFVAGIHGMQSMIRDWRGAGPAGQTRGCRARSRPE